VPTLSAQTVSTVAVVGTLVAVLALAGVAALAVALARVRRSYARLLAGGRGREDILAAIDRHLAAVERLARTTDALGREVAELRQRSSTLVRTVGLTRYDAFDDVGGRLSYSAAFLDEAGDGVVLSSINSRSETRSYAKPVEGGRSAHNLSSEEQAAIDLALGREQPVHTAGS
jgi:Protein of unknown function (DUF4446)